MTAKKIAAQAAERETASVHEVNAGPKKETKPVARRTYKAKALSPETLVTVKNGFNGMLVYVSKKYGERFIWSGFGDEQEMELQELKNAKNSNKVFFENNWFMISDPEVIAYLGVERYYKNALSFEDFDLLFDMQPDEIEARIALLSKGQKATLVYRAKQLITEQKIDSIKVINTLEKCLGVELIER